MNWRGAFGSSLLFNCIFKMVGLEYVYENH